MDVRVFGYCDITQTFLYFMSFYESIFDGPPKALFQFFVLYISFSCPQVGQFLMTLPQHLEPFTMQDNPSVLVALKHGKLPFTDETGKFILKQGRLLCISIVCTCIR